MSHHMISHHMISHLIPSHPIPFSLIQYRLPLPYLPSGVPLSCSAAMREFFTCTIFVSWENRWEERNRREDSEWEEIGFRNQSVEGSQTQHVKTSHHPLHTHYPLLPVICLGCFLMEFPMSASSSLWASSSCFSMSMLSQANLARFEHNASAVMSCDVEEEKRDSEKKGEERWFDDRKMWVEVISNGSTSDREEEKREKKLVLLLLLLLLQMKFRVKHDILKAAPASTYRDANTNTSSIWVNYKRPTPTPTPAHVSVCLLLFIVCWLESKCNHLRIVKWSEAKTDCDSPEKIKIPEMFRYNNLSCCNIVFHISIALLCFKYKYAFSLN